MTPGCFSREALMCFGFNGRTAVVTVRTDTPNLYLKLGGGF